ncbi:36435_t:CDS:2 [Gigaspora margarita]|uniref:36435_t:CDS:1 n=1 Tax=Gigaspora margarita TaxID=4874 RepID=A0ABN7ULX4_GIGMA|nr:36435_t:CDS:2 [Gigaspora margarita]
MNTKINDSQYNSSEDENFQPNQPKKRCRGGGLNRDPVWDDFNTGDSLARECAEVPYVIKKSGEIIWQWRKKQLEGEIKLKLIRIFKIISEEKQRQIDKDILKGWVCAGIPFETIDNPFIIDMFKL